MSVIFGFYIEIYIIVFSDDFVEFENDQANQNCPGKKFYSKEDTAVSTQTINDMADPLGVSFSNRYSNISDKDEELAILSQSLMDNDNSEKHLCVKDKKSHDWSNLD